MDQAMRGLSIVVPTYNESENILELLQRLERAIAGTPSLKAVPIEIIVVDDSSSDGTADCAATVAHHLVVAVRVLRRGGRRCLASSVVAGAHAARYAVVLVLDADLSHRPEDIGLVAAPVLSGAFDVSLGSRYVRGSRVAEDWPWRRRRLSALGTAAARLLTEARDPLSGFFACRRDLLDGRRLATRTRGYKILLEVLAHAHDARVSEVPITFEERKRGASKLRLRQKIEYVVQLSTLLLERAVIRARNAPEATGLKEERHA